MAAIIRGDYSDIMTIHNYNDKPTLVSLIPAKILSTTVNKPILCKENHFAGGALSERNGAALRSATGLVQGWTDAAFAIDG
jgi:hypothetical protein